MLFSVILKMKITKNDVLEILYFVEFVQLVLLIFKMKITKLVFYRI